MIQSFFEKMWYRPRGISWFFWPLSLVYLLITRVRRFYLQKFRQQRFKVPVIVVGNLTVGGAGKTPLVEALAKHFQAKGLHIGIVSRGYGATITTFPYEVQPEDSAAEVGDEPLLLARKLSCPVVIAPNRVQAVNYLLARYPIDLVISDDGLQHHAMGRAIEIAVVDGVRGLGNGFCLPAGPLRESANRLHSVDFVVVNSGTRDSAFSMSIQPASLIHLASGNAADIYSLQQPVAAVAGIGHPGRFFTTLKEQGVECRHYPFPDHYQFQPDDLCFAEASIIMTEKDAVKCKAFAAEHWYYLQVEAELESSFWQALWSHKQLKGYLR